MPTTLLAVVLKRTQCIHLSGVGQWSGSSSAAQIQVSEASGLSPSQHRRVTLAGQHVATQKAQLRL